ncbi:MAG: AzlD domain-containing protein [Alphaproteobacteria bacterium]|nr:MAG: AzlD domain-containing protein [Alphaproteobacteria bacterium]
MTAEYNIWLIAAAIGLGSWLIRFSFLGLIGDRQLPPWVMRHLRYTPVAVIPGLVAPLVVWPEATGGAPDPVRLGAALIALAAGALTRRLLPAVVAGMSAFWLLQWLLG